jgi:hypothetical protein
MAGEQPQNYWQPQEDEQQPAAPAPVVQPVQAPVAPTPASVMPEVQPQPQPQPQPIQPLEPQAPENEPTELPAEDTPDNPPITWNAQEYVHSDRSPLWFVIFIVVVLGLIAVDVFLLKSWTFSALVIVMAIALVIYIRRPPRTLTYALSPTQGLYVGERLYHFDDFKAFGLIQDGPHYSIMLIPRKRFAPGVSVYFPDEAGERIVDILGQRLPMETLKLDVVDVIVRKLRL